MNTLAAVRPFFPSAPNHLSRQLGLPRDLVIFLLVQMIAWTIVPAFATHSLTINTAELAMWTHEPFIVNYKHPGLITWVVWLAFDIFGSHLWVTYLVAQVFIASTYLFVFLLGRDILGERRALAGTLMLIGISYLTLSAFKLNHNTIEMPLWAAFSWALWHASNRRSLLWWLLAATIAAASLYGKFSSGMLLAFGAAWIVSDRATRAQLRSWPPIIALGWFLLLMCPLLVALIDINFLPFKWIAAESTEKGVRTSKFLFGQVQQVWGLPVIACLVGILPIGQHKVQQQELAELPAPKRPRRYLLVMGVGPLALVIAMAFVGKLRVEWTTPMYNLFGLLLVSAIPMARFSVDRLRRLTYLAGMVSLLLVIGYAGLALDNQYRGTKAWIVNWPAAEMSEKMQLIWQQQTGAPLKIVGGATFISSLTGLNAPSAPALFSRLDPQTTPSMTAERIRRDGVLVLWNADLAGWQPPAELLAKHVHGTETFTWSRNPAARPIIINYLIIPPASAS
jgi:4-amino-4-deoxy-L-arabinose transferase-like glycosyltransferase